MESDARLPLTDPLRLKARERKLWAREMSYAIREQMRISQPLLKISCPCRLCDRGYRQDKYRETVLKHLDARKMYGRDPKHYESTQGFPSDESDDEWDSNIIQAYGLLATETSSAPRSDTPEDDYVLGECVATAFETYDELNAKWYHIEEPARNDADENEEDSTPEPLRTDGFTQQATGEESAGRSETRVAHGHSVFEEMDTAFPNGKAQPGNYNDHRAQQATNEGFQETTSQPTSGEDSEQEEDFMEEEEPSWNQTQDNPMSTQEAVLRDAARTPLYPNAKVSSLSAVILLLNCLRMHGGSSMLIHELFTLLSKVILPEVNSLPTTEYEASNLLKQLGLNYDIIDVCPNQCLLFRGEEYANLDHCPKCGAARRRRCGKSMIPRRVLRYFPLIPRLIRMYRNHVLSEALSYAAMHKSVDGKMRSVADSEVWRFIDTEYPSFGEDPRNVRLALAIDGTNPFSDK